MVAMGGLASPFLADADKRRLLQGCSNTLPDAHISSGTSKRSVCVGDCALLYQNGGYRVTAPDA
jgi:hypothetical protein